MMNDLFSSMDYYWPSLSSLVGLAGLILSLVASFGVVLLSTSGYSVFSGMLLSIKSSTSKVLENLSSGQELGLKGWNLVLLSVFFFILGSNLGGLVPYVFGLTTQVVMTLGLSLSVWSALNISNLSYKVVGYVGHLTPTGSPVLLTPLLNVIEGVSNFMRFITLCLRLTMNISTGHMLLTLLSVMLSGLVIKGGLVVPGLVVLVCSGYFVFEFCIGLVQAFVFSLLVAQYTGEHSSL